MRAILLGPMVYPNEKSARPGIAWRRVMRWRVRPVDNPRRDWLVGVDRGALAWGQFGKSVRFAVGDWDGLAPRVRRVERFLARLPDGYRSLPVDKNRSER